MELCVQHYHFRPGGVRRVIELGLPALARAMGCTRVTLLAGEAPPPDWRALMEAALHPCGVEWCIEPALGYWSELTLSPADACAAIREALRRCTGPDIPLWAHNLSVGRNLLLAQEVGALPDNFPRWLHHHDWWWDGRWERWPEFQAQGFHTLTEAITATLPCGDAVRHFCVNAGDARRLSAWTGGAFHFLANPLVAPTLTAKQVADARDFLRWETDADECWLYPCRGIRRKNIAEALLVQKWLTPDAVTVTTGGPGRGEEAFYYHRLADMALISDWSLRLGLTELDDCPSVPALIAAADSVVITSLKEGFGLPYCEAAFAGRPCRARIPSGLDETLERQRPPFVMQWSSLPVPDYFFDVEREAARTAAGREQLLALLPQELQTAARSVEPAEDTGSTDFGALSLSAQFEVLRAFDRRFVKFPGVEPQPAPPFSIIQTPDSWARSLLASPGDGQAPWRHGWEDRGAEVISPLLHHWLRHPPLWPEM